VIDARAVSVILVREAAMRSWSSPWQKEAAMRLKCALVVALVSALTASAAQADATKGEVSGKPDLKSAGPLAFGPRGVLFIGDPKGAAIFAVDTKDEEHGARVKASINVDNIKQTIASLLGTNPEQVRIQDVAVNPASGKVYLSVSRGRGPDAQPVLIRVEADGKVGEFSLDHVAFTKAVLPNPPKDQDSDTGRGRQNNRDVAITDLAYIDGTVIVAGLSNEEFASNLRAIPYPFTEINKGASIEIFHGNHGRLETRSPVRTFVPVAWGGNPQIIAAYTCTPLVRIPLSDLRSGTKVRGTTIAELGNRNQPLDIIAYRKDGKDFLLLANAVRGVMKISTDGLMTREGITKKVRSRTAGQTYETISDWKGVTQLDQLDDANAIVLIEEHGQSHLRTLPLP
jgi:hypothetical protein